MQRSRTTYRTRQLFTQSGLWVVLMAFLAVAGPFNRALAQRHNASDWNVPPPLPPGSLTKGNTTGKPATVTPPIVLALADIPSVTLFSGPGVTVPDLPPLSTTPPAINSPDQPTILGIMASLPEIPLPFFPDLPPLPQRFLQDEQTPRVADVPMPAMPEMPAFPAEPTPSGQIINIQTPVPVTPDVAGEPYFSLHPGGEMTVWSTPGIPENVSFKLVLPGAGKGTGGRTTKKSNSNHKR